MEKLMCDHCENLFSDKDMVIIDEDNIVCDDCHSNWESKYLSLRD